ncbi:helix-turn-helix domain-containing protein [Shimia sp.]|uniref:helix-turn-helix domain-containing protein n=1 Tax=Shimia sp. TaxID=1954381 RepID=UPI003562E3DE
MIGRKRQRIPEETEAGPKGFDDYDLRLGDMMRGERATLGKSLLDVQRELRIKASYISAIENCDPSAFETPGFIAGYVRSYARYLGMDPETAFAHFCRESGFATAHGMSAEASTIRKADARKAAPADADPFEKKVMAFAPERESILTRIEPQAIGSSLVLVALIAAIGYGGWSVLNEIQRVQLAPVDQTPVVASDLDPLKDAGALSGERLAAAYAPAETLDRLYRPQALDVPVMQSRDAPIATLDPSSLGLFTPDRPFVTAEVQSDPAARSQMPQVVDQNSHEVVLMAVRPAWVRVRAADGSILLEKILGAGEEFTLPPTEEPPVLTAGMSGSVYFKLNGALYGPAGKGADRIGDLALDLGTLEKAYDLADLGGDPELARIVAEADAAALGGN